MQIQPERDTFEWLLTTDGCPYCGSELPSTAERCSACQRPVFLLVRSGLATTLFQSLGLIWVLGAVQAVVLAAGAWLQLAGLLPIPQPAPLHPSIQALAQFLKIRWSSRVVVAEPPPDWFVPTMVMIALLAGSLAWGTFKRQRWSLLVGVLLSLLPVLLGLGAALFFQGAPGLVAFSLGVVFSIALVFLHVVALTQGRTERQVIGMDTAARSAIGLFQAGRAAQQAGMTYLAARYWARAISKDPTNPAYLHALALALAQLGAPTRGLSLVERALMRAPNDPELQATAELLRHR